MHRDARMSPEPDIRRTQASENVTAPGAWTPLTSPSFEFVTPVTIKPFPSARADAKASRSVPPQHRDHRMEPFV